LPIGRPPPSPHLQWTAAPSTFTEPHQRARAFGVYGAVPSAGGAVGVLLGGAVTQFLDWRWCLYVNVLVAAVALLAGRRCCR
jgi:MFS family permease